MSEWRPVTETEPPMGSLVLLSWPRFSEPHLGWRSPSGWTAKTLPWANGDPSLPEPHFWMPLPERPGASAAPSVAPLLTPEERRQVEESRRRIAWTVGYLDPIEGAPRPGTAAYRERALLAIIDRLAPKGD